MDQPQDLIAQWGDVVVEHFGGVLLDLGEDGGARGQPPKFTTFIFEFSFFKFAICLFLLFMEAQFVQAASDGVEDLLAVRLDGVGVPAIDKMTMAEAECTSCMMGELWERPEGRFAKRLLRP